MTNRIVAAFQNIYDNHEWLGGSLSGPGSDPERTIEFRRFLERFIDTRGIQSVVDFGCGDWAYARLVNWKGKRYTGIDVVGSVIERNKRLYGSCTVTFALRDSMNTPLPPADLFIAKEVLQHLPSAEVQSILALASTYPYCIFVNDISHERREDWRSLWRWRSICEVNSDIEAGGYRLLSLRDPPFSLEARRAMTYKNRYRGLRWTKEVLVIERDVRSREVRVAE